MIDENLRKAVEEEYLNGDLKKTLELSQELDNQINLFYRNNIKYTELIEKYSSSGYSKFTKGLHYYHSQLYRVVKTLKDKNQ